MDDGLEEDDDDDGVGFLRADNAARTLQEQGNRFISFSHYKQQ